MLRFDASVSPRIHAACGIETTNRRGRRCNLHTYPRNSYSRCAKGAHAIALAVDRRAPTSPATPVGQSLLAVVGPPTATTTSRMPRTKRSARRRGRAARRAAARTRSTIRASARAAQPRPYGTDRHSRNERLARRIDSRRLRVRYRHDTVPGAVRSTSRPARTRHPAGAREAPAPRRSRSLRPPRSRASTLRARGRRRT